MEEKDHFELAIRGGTPIFSAGPPPWPIADDIVLNSVRSALADNSWGGYNGVWTEKVIQAVCEMANCEHALLCSSGTIAVEIALRGMDVQPETEVVLAAYDFPGNFRAIEAIGARPVIADVVEGGWVLDPNEVELAITDKTSAVVASHLHGQFADIAKLKEICERRGIGLLEDACQVPGASINQQAVGSFGNAGVFSFGGSKLLSAGRGGAVTTSDKDIYQRAKIFCNRGNDAFPLSQLQAAALLPQFSKLADRNQQRNESARIVIEETREMPHLTGMSQVITTENSAAYYKIPWLSLIHI